MFLEFVVLFIMGIWTAAFMGFGVYCLAYVVNTLVDEISRF